MSRSVTKPRSRTLIGDVRIASISLVFGMFWAASVCFGQIEVGDDVRFTRAGETFSGKVVGVRPGGKFLEVETTISGSTRKLIVPLRNVTPATQPAGRELRTWTDSTGRFKIEAVFESQTAFEVVLRKQDGTKIKVAIDKLSAADQEYVAGLDSQSGGNPFEAGVMGSSGSSSDSGSDSIAARAPGELSLPTPKVFRKASATNIQDMAPPAAIEADPSPLDFQAISNASMKLPAEENREDVGRPVIISETGTQLCYSVRAPRSSSDDYTRIIAIDGERRKTSEVARLGGHRMWVCSADPASGDVLGIVMKQGDDKSHSLCVISGIRDSKPSVVAHWRMFPEDEKKSDYVRYRKLVPNQMVVVVFGGQLHGYDYGSQREVWTVPSKLFNEPAISPGGRYTAIVVDQQCAILETKTGKQIGSIPINWNGPTSLGFSADATRLAMASGAQVRVVDLAKGEDLLVHEANVSLGAMGKPVMWLEDDFLLLPTGHLLSLKRNLIVWRYIIDQDALEYTDLENHGLLTFTGRGVTSIVRLPHAAATAAADRDTSNIAAVKSGDPLAIVANGSGPGVTQGDLRNWLADAASRSGYQPASSAPTQLVATITRGKQTQQSYRTFGSFGSEDVNFTPYISKVEFRQNGITLWQRTTQSSMPHMVSGDKSLQQVAREHERPDAGFFQNMALPPAVLKPEFQNGFGNSRVSATGIMDMNR